ncbi:hypothetical protein SAMD00019534_005120 [Acytostelium subglobosum LB1]|uniref:hypothetical protein n=1 Tax=Acytostelium subglobosum LB1 TaxID=1410327 RepID=UPI000644D0EC|nr:hypothetical protein SAMD00019534_005120 [Acytostelium subglobosum LB1]GAM17337.1 hypothetical protein SAMD00019534_005120 [Acytostelium subglobosum LB1]|eukprot:XP_012759399.1 hypothetical protein SAMD00019534_005120 [Acytostelium subglobosum LB1]
MSANEKELFELQKEINDLEKSQATLKEKGYNFKEQINAGFKNLDEICSTLDKQDKATNQLARRLPALPSSEEASEMKSKIGDIRNTIKQSKKTFLPETGSMFVRLFLGQVNVKHYREGERFRLKTEYEKFKSKTNPQFLGFVVLLLLFPSNTFIMTTWQIWMLYYYVTLALRENILLVNGSSIRPWWITHHYMSIAGSLTNLLWPPYSASFTHFLPQLTYISGLQGLVQILSSKYQQGQLYKLTAMGKANIMDVTGENMISDPGWTPSALFLLPFLILVHCFELFNGVTFLLYSAKSLEWQVAVMGIIFVILSIGNFVTTVQIYMAKWSSTKQEREISNGNGNGNVTKSGHRTTTTVGNNIDKKKSS